MKFGELLLRERISQWASFYLDYDALKDDIDAVKELIPHIWSITAADSVANPDEFKNIINRNNPFQFLAFRAKIQLLNGDVMYVDCDCSGHDEDVDEESECGDRENIREVINANGSFVGKVAETALSPDAVNFMEIPASGGDPLEDNEADGQWTLITHKARATGASASSNADVVQSPNPISRFASPTVASPTDASFSGLVKRDIQLHFELFLEVLQGGVPGTTYKVHYSRGSRVGGTSKVVEVGENGSVRLNCISQFYATLMRKDDKSYKKKPLVLQVIEAETGAIAGRAVVDLASFVSGESIKTRKFIVHGEGSLAMWFTIGECEIPGESSFRRKSMSRSVMSPSQRTNGNPFDEEMHQFTEHGSPVSVPVRRGHELVSEISEIPVVREEGEDSEDENQPSGATAQSVVSDELTSNDSFAHTVYIPQTRGWQLWSSLNYNDAVSIPSLVHNSTGNHLERHIFSGHKTMMKSQDARMVMHEMSRTAPVHATSASSSTEPFSTSKAATVVIDEAKEKLKKQLDMLALPSNCRFRLMTSFPDALIARTGIDTGRVQLALYLYNVLVNMRFRKTWITQINKVETFYRRESELIAASAAATIDTAKRYNSMSEADKSQLKHAFRVVLHSLEMLQQYCDLNEQAMTKILKKFDKVTHQDALAAYTPVFGEVAFATGTPSRITLLRDDVVEAYTKYVCDGSRKDAFVDLFYKDQVKELHGNQTVVAFVGVLAGASLILLILSCIQLASIRQPLTADNAHNTSYILGLTFALLLLPMLFTVNVAVWTRYNINFAFMFDLDSIEHWNALDLMTYQGPYILVWAACAYAFSNTAMVSLHCQMQGNELEHESAIPAWVYPYLIVPIWFVIFIITECRSRQHWFLDTWKRLLLTPLYPIQFSEFFIADQLTSLGGSLYELQFFWCAFHSDSVTETCRIGRSKHIIALNLLPNIWRLLQCIRRYHEPSNPEDRRLFPHGVNAMKYFSSILSTGAGFFYNMSKHYATEDSTHDLVKAAFIVNIVIHSISTLFKSWWDVFVDFAVFDLRTLAPREKKKRVYGHFRIYMVGTAIDLILRWAWLVKLLVGNSNDTFKNAEYTFIIFAAIEVYRRFNWNFFRVENEQVNNIESYRSTNFAPLPKRHLDTSVWSPEIAEEIQKRMQGEDHGTQHEKYGVDNTQWTAMVRFFAYLNGSDKVRILRTALPDEDFDSEQFSGKTQRFSLLPEETKVHAILELLGDKTMAEYQRFAAELDASPSTRRRTTLVAPNSTPSRRKRSTVDT